MNFREEIQFKLAAYRSKLKQSFVHSELRAALLQILRSLDLETVATISQFYAGKSPYLDENATTVKWLFNWGFNEAFSLFWGDHVRQNGIPLFQTCQEIQIWSESLLQCCGRIRLIEHALELERIQLAKISRVSEGVFECAFDKSASGVEKIEKDDLEFFNILIGRHYKTERSWEKLYEKRPPVAEKMRALVRPWKEHYICYDADPEVDDFYNEFSMLVAPTRLGFDAFPPESIFGGIPFMRYVDCVRVLMGFALKHMDFCLLLCGRHSEIKPADIVSVPSDWVKSVDYLSYALNVSKNDAEQLLLTTTLTPENASYHLQIPCGPFACQYMIGKGSVVRSITGCLDNPFQFMLRELKRRFPDDWDKSVAAREDKFRADLFRIFIPFNRVAIFTDNVNICSDKGKTDIDMLAVDLVSKTVGIFQLKWQDMFGHSIRERESKKANFLKTGNAWVEKVSRWLDEGKMPGTLISLGLPKEVAMQVRKTRLFVLGRNFSHFSGDGLMDERAAWGTWVQVLRLLDTKAVGESPITILHDQLILDSPHKRAQRSSNREEIKIPGMTLISHFES